MSTIYPCEGLARQLSSKLTKIVFEKQPHARHGRVKTVLLIFIHDYICVHSPVNYTDAIACCVTTSAIYSFPFIQL